jgi:hypothetical protein
LDTVIVPDKPTVRSLLQPVSGIYCHIEVVLIITSSLFAFFTISTVSSCTGTKVAGCVGGRLDNGNKMDAKGLSLR